MMDFLPKSCSLPAPMNITFACPDCDTTSRLSLDDADSVSCAACDWKRPVKASVAKSQQVDACLVCGCQELFLRKNFSQRVGVTIVVLAALGSSVAWAYHQLYLTYAILFAAAALDLVLYFSVGNLLQCYRCHAEYRGLAGLESGEPFSLETHERFRQQAIRLAENEGSEAKGA